VTPGEFPDYNAFLAYVQECEQSQVFQYCDDDEPQTFGHATAFRPVTHVQGCGESDEISRFCGCAGDQYGLVYPWSNGTRTATHHAAPMFTIKDDLVEHKYEDMPCYWCEPEHSYYNGGGGKPSIAEAEKKFWEEWNRDREGEYMLFFTEMGVPAPRFNPDKIGLHP
jgi:hypothetical protein